MAIFSVSAVGHVSLLVTHIGQPPGTGFSGAETGPQNGAPCIRRHRVTEIVMKKSTLTAGKIGESSRIERKPNWVVADAVLVEPVSASKFPVIRENNREFCEWDGVLPVCVPKRREYSKGWAEIPCQNQTGNFLARCGNPFRETRCLGKQAGNFPRRPLWD